ncbi:formate/nitrate family transporter [Aureobasidium pullulans]|uniref:Formate/nitrate family transporter n=1 Tax=Aureobasidium pullulans TaxID=5580 RepID=A0A4T0B3N1_AURPU|nr:formate/nitrate family transporter [Aureobasidium pullulans]
MSINFHSYPSATMELPPRTQAPLPVVHNAYSPKEAIEISSRAGAHKATMRIDKIIVSSFMAGCLLSFGGACYTVINTSTWYNENAPGLVRMFGALIFPFGLVVIVMTGADLCTGSFMYTTLSTLHRRTSILLMLRHWLLTFFGNLAGALFVTGIIVYHGGVLSASPYREEVLKIATTKAVTPQWHEIFVKAIGANWLVCLACFLACCAREFFSKIMLHHPDISIGYYIWKSMIPAALGNIVGGSVFVAAVYWYLYLNGESSAIVVDGASFDLYGHESEGSSMTNVPQGQDSKRDDGKMV